MHIPSEQVYNKMRAEAASIWYVPANNGEETAFLIKAPTPTLKALIAGCPLQLLFGMHENCLCTGARIFDMPDTPLMLSGAQIILEEHMSLIQSIKELKFPLFLFNEMDICIASAVLSITEKDSLAILEFVGDCGTLYTGGFDGDISHAIDCFISSLDKTKTYQNAHDIPTIEVSPKSSNWVTNNIYFISNDASYGINILNKDEGRTFETSIWGALESVFSTTLYKEPQLQHGDKVREFTDVFAYYEYGSFIIEAKDLSVIQAGFERNETKRLSGIQKQVEKAIKQLVGSTKKFKQGAALLDNKGKQIQIDRKVPPHCIVLITELMECGNWDGITQQLIDAMQESDAFFHILDFREFITLLKQSSGDPKLIDYNLMERCKLFMDKRSVFIRSI